MVCRKGGLMKAATCSVLTMVGHLMGVDLALKFLRLHLKVLKLVLFNLREVQPGFPRCSLKVCSLFGQMRMAGKELVLPSLPCNCFTSCL